MEEPKKPKKERKKRIPPPHIGRKHDRCENVEQAQAIADEISANRREWVEPPEPGDDVWDMPRERSNSIPTGDKVSIDEVKLIGDANAEGAKMNSALKMDAFIAYMLTGQTWRQAASNVGITVQTASKWMRKRTLKKRMAKFREVLAEAALTRISTLTNSAVTTLEDAMGQDNHIQFRLQGAKLLFDAFVKMNQIVGMEQRLKDIEESLGVAGTAMPHHGTATNTAAMTAAALENMKDLGLDLPGEDDGVQRPVDSEADLAG